MLKAVYYSLALISALGLTEMASAAIVVDAVGDFTPRYTDAAADLDVTSFSVRYNPGVNIFTLAATMAGVIDPATSGVYIIGVNTGTGPIAPFSPLGAPNVRFNQVVRVNKDGTASSGATALAATIVGNMFSIDVPANLFPSTGFAQSEYTWNLWPRTGLGAGTLVTDFAPDNGMLAGSVPEPATWALMLTGIGLLGGSLRARRRQYARVA